MVKRLVPYGRFLGLDSITAVDNMNERYLEVLTNAYIDFRGQIIKGPGSKLIEASPSGGKVKAVQHFGAQDAVYFYEDNGFLSARTTTGRSFTQAFSGVNQPIMFTQFAGKMVASVKDQDALTYDGVSFIRNSNIPKGGCNATVLNRLCIADLSANTTQFQLSKLDNISDFGVTTPAASSDGGTFDIRNQLSGRDEIRGLGNLEGDKLAVYCRNETLVYSGNSQIANWVIVRDFRVPVGTIGRNTVRAVGTDNFFCSAFGIHALRRAASGLTLETIQLSRVVQDLYRDLVAAIPDGQEPSAVWNGNIGQYTVFFPTSSSPVRLVLTYDPLAVKGGFSSWSYATNDGSSCGSFFAGQLLNGSADGEVFNGEQKDAAVDMRVKTPILWQGAPTRQKQYKRLYVRVSGTAQFTVNVYNENDQLLQSSTHQPNPPATFDKDVPFKSPERPISIPCEHKGYGIRVEFICTNSGTLKILDFAVDVEG